MGGRDIDLALGGCSIAPSEAEEALEELLAGFLSELGIDPYRDVKVPNVVEVHTTDEIIVKKSVELGPPFSRRLC